MNKITILKMPMAVGLMAFGVGAVACGSDGAVQQGMPPIVGGAGAPGSMIPGGDGDGNPPPVVVPNNPELQGSIGFKAIHRLNRTEYNATVADVLGTTLQPANGSWRDGEIDGFDNLADVQLMDEAQYQRYFDAAAAVADDVFAKPELVSKFVTCATPDDACVNTVIQNFGSRLFRRPLLDTELANFRAVYTAVQGLGDNHEASLKQVLRAILGSGEFIYRIELDPTPDATEPRALTPYELASRLSYFLTSSAPDDAMLSAAADGSLLGDEAILATVDRLLADPVRGQRFVQNFYGQWLGARRVADHAVAPDVYPEWNPQLAAAMTQEMYAYFDDFLANDRPWTEFLTRDQNFVDAELAELYGLPAPAAAGMQKVEVNTDARMGFLGLGGFLAQSSLDRRTSPTLRGRWIMRNLLCTEPPAPPPNVPKLEDVAAVDLSQGNVAEVLKMHREDPTCAGCHALFDPYGIALENFDGLGRERATYTNGSAVSTETTLKGMPVNDMTGLTSYLTAQPEFKECIAENMTRYGLGRVLTPADDAQIEVIQQKWDNGADVLSLRRLLQSIVLTDSFRFRRSQPVP